MSDPEFLQRTFGLDGRLAMVTGASSGIGVHIAKTLAKAGCNVALTARRLAKLTDLATDINADKHSGTAQAFELDVTDGKSAAAAIDKIINQFGAIDMLINNAGIADSQKFLDMTESEWHSVIDTDLTAVWRISQLVANKMISQKIDAEKGGKAIVNIASILGLAAQISQTNYGAAKAGVIHLTKIMALELSALKLGQNQIRVNAIAPGYFATEINTKFLQSERGRDYIANLVPQRIGQLRELDGAILLLTSPAGSYINGSVITVDGGTILGRV